MATTSSEAAAAGSKWILVTGGAGFIGSHSVLELINAGYDVVVVDNFANACKNGDVPESLARVSQLVDRNQGQPIEFVECDSRNQDKLRTIFQKYKFYAIIHLAALKAVGESVSNPLMYYDNNILGSIALIEVAREFGVKNFIFSSSATVYGTPESLPLTEECEAGMGLTNPYGTTKYFVEQILQDLHKAEPDWNMVILRYFNPVGAHPSGQIGEDPKGTPNNLMPYVSQVAVGKLPHVNVYGNDYDTHDGTGVRDYIHIVDLAKGHVAALKKVEEGNIGCKIYNLGTGTGYSVLDMIKAMEKACGHEIAHKVGARREGDLASVYCDPKKAAAELGWKAEYGLEDMCKHLWNWQSKNPNGFRKAE